MAYSNKVIDRFESVLKDPKKHAVGRFDPKDPNVATGLVGAPACGDVMKLDLKMNGDVIEDVKFKTYGCGSAIASSSLVTELIKGIHIDDCVSINNKDISKFLNLPPVKLHCSMLAEDAIKMAVNNFKSKNAD